MYAVQYIGLGHTSSSCPKISGGLAMRTTPRTRVAAAKTRKTPQRSLSRNTDRVITFRITLLGPATNTNTSQRG